jgi:hypothetical protein
MASSIVCIARPVTQPATGARPQDALWPCACAIPRLPQFAQNRVDGRIALIGVGAVVGDGLLGGKSHGVITNHVCVPRDASDCSLGSHGLDSSRAGSHRSWPWGDG